MKTRIISGIVIAALLILMLISGGYVLAVCLCAVSIVALYELSRAFHLRTVRAADGSIKDAERITSLEMTGYVGTVIHYALLVLTKGDARFIIGTLIAVFFADALIYVARFPRYRITQTVEAIFCFLYAPVMLSAFYQIRCMEWGHIFVWMPFLAWVCDTGAYFSGMAFGKHKLCPRLSPKKTVEGAIGGTLLTTAAGAILGVILPVGTTYYNRDVIYACILIGLAVGVLSQFGDLLASGMKRDLGIKDFGRLIPGHGGIMDRFDSVIFVTPVVYFLIIFMLH